MCIRDRDLIWLFVKRDFTVMYKQTVLGPAWILINPLLSTAMYLSLIHISRIIAEKFIENDGGDLYDYKIFCFDGEPKIILHIEERYTDKEERRCV